MSLVTPDFSDLQEEIQPGTYKCIIKKGEVREWPSGEKYINWEYETFGEAEPRNNGRRIFDKTALSGKAAFRLQRLYRAATGESLKGSFDTDQLAGKQIEVAVKINPKGYADVEAVRPLMG